MAILNQLKADLLLHIKNIYGWKTRRKIVVFSVDDYGNVRLDSKQARERMNAAGLKIYNRFDEFDALEDETDLLMLFDTLRSVKDKNGHAAVFTPFALPSNINFEKVAESGYSQFYYELLPDTYSKLNGYQQVYALIQQGIREQLYLPQFHGREHLNLKLFNENLAAKDHDTLEALKNRSYSSIGSKKYATISSTAAFDFSLFEENHAFDNIIREGLDAFEQVYGYRAVHFNPPGGREHPYIHRSLQQCGIKYIDTPWVKIEHQGSGKYKKRINYTGKKNKLGQVYQVRNCVFEPTEKKGVDWVAFCMKQVEAAFKWHRPAIISSHRVNFSGHIDPANRKAGIDALQQLLKKIVAKWPEVEFMAANQLGDLILNDVL